MRIVHCVVCCILVKTLFQIEALLIFTLRVHHGICDGRKVKQMWTKTGQNKS